MADAPTIEYGIVKNEPAREFLDQVSLQAWKIIHAGIDRLQSVPRPAGHKLTNIGGISAIIVPVGERPNLFNLICRVDDELKRVYVMFISDSLTGKATVSQGADQDLGQGDLLDEIVAKFSKDELEELCFRLGINHEMFSSSGSPKFVMEILMHCKRAGLLKKLGDELPKVRENVDWTRFSHLLVDD